MVALYRVLAIACGTLLHACCDCQCCALALGKVNRANTGFRHLFRADPADPLLSLSPLSYLEHAMGGLITAREVEAMAELFPPLATLSAERHLAPKLKFLELTMSCGDEPTLLRHVPPQFYGARLESTVAPRHGRACG